MEISQIDIQEALNSEDIEGLLALGSPRDEYSNEARNIASALNRIDQDDLTEIELTEIVRTVWIRAFGPFSEADVRNRTKAFQQVAHEIRASANLSAKDTSIHTSR